MLCPNCSEQLETKVVSNQSVLHCSNCGGNFFQENSINRITASDAQELTKDSQSNLVMGSPKVCPRDSIFLHLLENEEAIPKNVNLFKCPKCSGIFAYPDDLLKFKKAQNIKIEFYKIWENPVPSLKAVLVLSLIAVISLTVFSNLSNRNIQTTQAEDLITNTSFSHEGRYLFVNFRTSTPFISSIVITDRTTNSAISTQINKISSDSHFATVTDLNPQHDLYYQIILSDGEGLEIKTEEKKLNIR